MSHSRVAAVAAAATLVLSSFVLPAPARAHVTLQEGAAPAGSSYRAVFRVGHGCAQSPTREIAVEVPDGVSQARPMPKPGWALAVERRDGRVARIVWRARTDADALPVDQYDEFVLVARLPEQPGPLYWSVGQACEQGRADWAERPLPGQRLSELKAPAALLDVQPVESASSHHHH